MGYSDGARTNNSVLSTFTFQRKWKHAFSGNLFPLYFCVGHHCQKDMQDRRFSNASSLSMKEICWNFFKTATIVISHPANALWWKGHSSKSRRIVPTVEKCGLGRASLLLRKSQQATSWCQLQFCFLVNIFVSVMHYLFSPLNLPSPSPQMANKWRLNVTCPEWSSVAMNNMASVLHALIRNIYCADDNEQYLV